MIPDCILRKIEHCLALSASDNPNEAAIAPRQAQKLMAEHGLTQLDLAAAQIGEHSARARSGKTLPNCLGGLAAIVAEALATSPERPLRRLLRGARLSSSAPAWKRPNGRRSPMADMSSSSPRFFADQDQFSVYRRGQQCPLNAKKKRSS